MEGLHRVILGRQAYFAAVQQKVLAMRFAVSILRFMLQRSKLDSEVPSSSTARHQALFQPVL
jgi:hypothetical protein